MDSAGRATSETTHEQSLSDSVPLVLYAVEEPSFQQKMQNVDASRVRDIQVQSKECFWLPLTLRLPYLSFVFVLSLSLGALALVVTTRSAQNNGLGSENRSSLLFFGWRFSPTLLATIYGLLVVSILNDVRRTEIFARLSSPEGALAEHSVCFPSRLWWNDPIDALSNGKKSRALFFSSTVYILALIISPLSAGLLSPAVRQIPRTAMFQRAKITDFSWREGVEDLVMFRTISGAILEQSTSVWLTKASAILPFWPSSLTSAPLRSKLTTDARVEQWQMRTAVYTVELDCQPMSLIAQYNATYNGTLPSDTTEKSSVNYAFSELQSQDGCVITLADYLENVWSDFGGGWWAGPPGYNSSLLTGISNSTSTCGNRTMFFVRSAPRPAPKRIDLKAHLCSARFYSAEVLATLSINQSSTVITFDPDESDQNKKLVDSSTYKLPYLEKSFLSSNWSSHFLRYDEGTPSFDGPLMSIAASDKYNNDPDKLLADSNLLQQATELYQQFFGEMLLAAVEDQLEADSETVPGQIIVFKQRIVVTTGIGMTLAIILLCCSGCIAFVAYATRLNRRGLNLVHEPGTVSSASMLIAANEDTRSAFYQTDQLSSQALFQNLGNSRFAIVRGDLLLIEKSKDINKGQSLPLTSLATA